MLRVLPKLAMPALLLVVGAIFVERVVFYFPFLSDDALITLRYAQRFVEGQGLTWTDGERVEGYTDFAWVVLTAAFKLFRVDLILGARVLGAIGAASALIFTSLTSKFSLSGIRIVSGALFLALSDPLAAWTNGALEHAFEAGVIVTAAWFLMHGHKARALLIILVLLRADGAVVISGLLLGHLLATRELKKTVLLGLPPLGALALQHLARRAYYGEWVPNTALVKVGFSLARAEQGLMHLRLWLQFAWPLLMLVVIAVIAARKLTPKTWLIPLVGSFTWFVYVVAIGGDIFPAWRQVLLGLAPLGLVIADGAEAWWTNARWKSRTALGLIIASLAITYAGLQRQDPANARAKTERWEQEGQSLGPALRAAWGDRKPLLAVDAAGTLPYYSRLPSLDLLGLCDRFIATHPPELSGRLSMGHELGNGVYAFSRKPDILALCGGMGGRNPCFLSGKEMFAQPGFTRLYQLMRYHTPGPPALRGELWIRREDSVLGMERSNDRVRIPGWLLSERSGVTELDRGQFRSRVSSNEPANMEAIELPVGTRWRIVVEPASPSWTIAATCDGQQTTRVRDGAPIIEVPASGKIGLLVGTPTSIVQSIDAVILERVTDQDTLACGARSEISARFLATRVEDHALVVQPQGVTMINGSPLIIRLTAGHGARFEASLDANDTYRLRALKDGAILSEQTLPTSPGGGLVAQQFEVPIESDALELTPVTGDQLSGIGHLIERL